MKKCLRIYALIYSLTCTLIACISQQAIAQQDSPASNAQQAVTVPDGQHDFDFEIGTWKTHLSRLLHPPTGSTTWVAYEGTTIVRRVWNGRANLVELDVDGSAGHIQGLSLRLYNPDSHQWSLNFASISSGTVDAPTVGEFKNGRGEFYDQETLNGRSILVRFVISDITQNSCHFEQAFSKDGGKSWEVNWIATDTRIKGEADKTN
ncbi:hypothetical protein [Solimicrobium silvestre]|uniref:DUF1579 domain-containing protein n=1 Tax=Solimicrobium silvestre TaxID=2099400 RepID=A0A2S9H365_9BURK|nr:hypothetical protein [Solimicrobium silvestre]PRC94306.1 hypothetical protein S2091_0927 [Solimicrobium silvestre]